MTTHDILRIALHVAVVQAFSDFISRKLVFEKDAYKKACSNLERMRAKRDKTLVQTARDGKAEEKKKGGLSEKALKRRQRAEEEYGEAVAEVSRKHAVPSMMTSLLFFILYRVLQTEYTGRILAVLPFVPFSLAQTFTRMGLPKLSEIKDVDGTNPAKACGFFFIYMLSTISVKFLVNKLIGQKLPEGCDGMSSMLESPHAQKMMQNMGVDPEEVLSAKNAAKKALS